MHFLIILFARFLYNFDEARVVLLTASVHGLGLLVPFKVLFFGLGLSDLGRAKLLIQTGLVQQYVGSARLTLVLESALHFLGHLAGPQTHKHVVRVQALVRVAEGIRVLRLKRHIVVERLLAALHQRRRRAGLVRRLDIFILI